MQVRREGQSPGLSVVLAAGTKEKVKGIFHAHGNGKIIEKTSNQVA
jgi:RNA 3'-terminal phosphate cyclase